MLTQLYLTAEYQIRTDGAENARDFPLELKIEDSYDQAPDHCSVHSDRVKKRANNELMHTNHFRII